MGTGSLKVFLDTHAAAALAEDSSLLGRRARSLVERAAIFVSPLVRLELQCLFELGRIVRSADEVIEMLVGSVGLAQTEDPMAEVVLQAMDLEWTRDPFDRLLVATARLHRAPLITKDQTILEHFSGAVW